MSPRALIIAVEKYPLLREALAGDLSDTVATALAFREWLVTTKQVPEANILFCSEPRVPESTAGATRAEIRMAKQPPGILHNRPPGRQRLVRCDWLTRLTQRQFLPKQATEKIGFRDNLHVYKRAVGLERDPRKHLSTK